MKIIDYVFPYLSNHKRKFFLYSFLSLVLWSLSLITPYSVGNYLDSLLQYKSDTVIWETVAMLAIFWTMQLVLSYTKNIVKTVLKGAGYGASRQNPLHRELWFGRRSGRAFPDIFTGLQAQVPLLSQRRHVENRRRYADDLRRAARQG